MLWGASWLGLVVVTACKYDAPSLVEDGPPPDVPPDTATVTWTIDETSGKAVPASTTEWTDFITANSLNMFPPDGLWLLQEGSGALSDTIGAVDLGAIGTAGYQQQVAGWSRRAITMTDGAGVVFFNNSDLALPDVSTSSMLILMLYANEATPAARRSVLFGGAGPPSNLGMLDIDASNRYQFTVGGTVANGTSDHGNEVHPVLLQLDKTSSVQRVLTNRETITPTFTPLGASRGIFLGAGNQASPEGRYLYLTAWYGPAAELSTPDLAALLAALGW